MRIYTSYSVKIRHYNSILKETLSVYRNAVDFFLHVCLNEWDILKIIDGQLNRQSYIESLCHKTKENPVIRYDFDGRFYKFPSYLRRSAISEAIGKVSSYKSNLANWEQNPAGKAPSVPRAGFVYPCMYRDNMFIRTGRYTARIKVFIRNTWDWINVELKKSDADYIFRHCTNRKECAPTLCKRGRQWFLDFSFEENTKLVTTDVRNRKILAVDLGINNACTCCIMTSDGTVLGRHFFKTPAEKDCLNHKINRIKKAQQHGARKTPRLWAAVNGVNKQIAIKTAQFIMDTAILYDVDTIVFEHLDLNGRKHGSKKQRLHLWRAKYVQSMVTLRAHRNHMRISHVCAWGTSKLAYDGSGDVERGKFMVRGEEKYNYSICIFPNGKQYNCDLNASYNIGARYFIRELLKSLPETVRLSAVAEVPRLDKRSTCTWSSLISLNAVLAARCC